MKVTDTSMASRVVVECTPDGLQLLPDPMHVLDYQTGTLRAEIARTQPNLVALALCGLRATTTKENAP